MADLAELARAALSEQTEAAALPVLQAHLAQNPDDVPFLHWLALLHRALDQRAAALTALRHAAVLAPGSAPIAQALAQVALEAGLPASALFAQADKLAPNNSQILRGRFAARFAEGDGAGALRDLAALVRGAPAWHDGHRLFAQLAAMAGQPERALATVEQAQAAHPAVGELYVLEAELLLLRQDYPALLAAAERTSSRFGDDPALGLQRAIALDELGQLQAASAQFDRLGPATEAGHAVRLLRHLIRRERWQQAAATLEPWLTGPPARAFWPYAALIWPALADPRAEWLEGAAGMVRVIDLDPAELDLPALTTRLRALHARSGRFLDQSVRGGTQTDGALFARIDPELIQLRSVVVAQVEKHLADLPAPDSQHPALGVRRDRPVRFAGSWSVRLSESGHHSSHHHPQGWFSSALYVAVPDGLAGDEGVLVLGEGPPDLGAAGPAARHRITPMPGRLVLFPSCMWHATRPFAAGERLSVAFDVAIP